jgi:RND family efflux transporter MFP subunit
LRRTVIFLGAIGALVGLAAFLRHTVTTPVPQAAAKEEALPLEVMAARMQPMPVALRSVGQVISQHTVQIRPQVSGMLKGVFFKEGEFVSKGQRLFQIEPAPFEAALTSARAASENAKGNADRLESIVKKGYVTQQDYRNVRALADQAQAAYQQALINLSYTELRAPIAGRTGTVTVKSGNIVAPADATQLVTINEMQPILVQFNISQQFLPSVRQHQARAGIRVSVTDDKDVASLDEGALVFIDNAVDAGTIVLKAQMPNGHEQLWPGQYVNVSMQLTVQPNAIVVPQTAIQTGQNGNYVYVVEQGKAEVREVRVDRQMGDLAVLSTGLEGHELVIVKAPRDLRVGTKVSSAAGASSPPAEVTLPKS